MLPRPERRLRRPARPECARPKCARPNRSGLSLLELTLATSLLAILAVAAVPAVTSRTDAISSTRRQLLGDLSLARRLAVLHAGDCDLTLAGDGVSYTLTSSNAEIAAELQDIAESNALGSAYARRLGVGTAAGRQVAPITAAVGTVGGGAVSVLTFSPRGGLDGRFDHVAITYGTSTAQQTLTVDFRTGATTASDVTAIGGGP